MIEVFSQPTTHKNLVILAFIGAELAKMREVPKIRKEGMPMRPITSGIGSGELMLG